MKKFNTAMLFFIFWVVISLMVLSMSWMKTNNQDSIQIKVVELHEAESI